MLEGRPGYYAIEVTELSSGCVQDFEIQLPGAQPLTANFELNPKVECINIIDNRIEIIDLSSGYSEGWIDYGDGTPLQPLGLGILAHEYEQIGDFVVTQYVSNDIGCADTLSLLLCVENKIRFYIPNAFSPNEDEVNDLLFINAFGVEDVTWSTYDRWGNKLFEANSLDEGWNGVYKGKMLQPGVYVVKFEFTDPVSGRRQMHWRTVTLM
jgi:gliding motility-associated-like protein